MRFAAFAVLIALLLTAVVLPWVDLPWVKVFRRCGSIAAGISPWLCIRKLERRSFSSYGLSLQGAGKRQLLFGLCLGVSTLGVLLLVGLASGVCKFDVISDHVRLWRTVITFVPAAAVIGVLEELVFRGFLLQHLAAYSRPLALLATSGLYALVHVKGLSLSLSTGIELGGLFLFGAVLAVSYFLTNGLSLAIGLHAVLAYGTRINKLLVAFPDPSIVWLTGTNRLVNGVVGWIVLVAIGGMIVWWARWLQGGGRIRHGDA